MPPPVPPLATPPVALTASTPDADRPHTAQIVRSLPTDRSEAPRARTAPDWREPSATVEPGHVDSLAVERLVGGRWAAAIGALIVLVAIGLFLQYAYESAWFGRISPAARCGFAALFGLGLLIVGEVVRRRVHAVAAIGLWIAGLGTLYLTVYAASVGLALIDVTTAIVLMMGVSLVGVALTIRAGSVTVGVLSIAAGYAAPFIIADEPGTALGLPTLMTMLLTIGLGLSAAAVLGRAPRRFALLRPIVVAMHIVVATMWWGLVGPEAFVTLTFLVLWWAMGHGESLYASMTGRAHEGTPAISLIITAWAAIVGVIAINDSPLADGIWSSALLVGLAICAVGAVVTVGPGIEALRRAPRDPMDAFAVSSWGQAGLLVVAAAAAHFGGAGLTVVWLAIAAASIEFARRVGSVGVTAFAWCVLALALGKLMTVDLFLNTALRQPLGDWLAGIGVKPTGWTLLALACAGVTLHAGARLGDLGAAARSTLQAIGVVIAVALAMLAVELAALENQPLASAMWGIVGVGLIAIGFMRERQALRVLGLVVLGMTVLKFLLVDLHGTATLWRIASMLLVGLLIVGVSTVYLRLERGLERGWEKAVREGDGTEPLGTTELDEELDEELVEELVEERGERSKAT